MIYRNKIKKTRLSKGMLQIQLAAKSDINFATVSRLENGWLKPTGEQKKKLARALEVKTNWLFPETKKIMEKKK